MHHDAAGFVFCQRDALITLATHPDPEQALQIILSQIRARYRAAHGAVVTQDGDTLCALHQAIPPRPVPALSQHQTWPDPEHFGNPHSVDSHLVLPIPATDTPLALVLTDVAETDQSALDDLRAIGALIRLAYDRIAQTQPTPTDSLPGKVASGDNDQNWHTLRGKVDRLTAAQALSIQLIDNLLSAPHALLDDTITSALGQMGDFCGSDRTYLFCEISDTLISNTHEWCAPGIDPAKDLLQNQPIGMVQPWYDAFETQTAIYIQDVSALPADDDIRKILEMQGIQSLLSVPLRHDGRIFGFVGYDAVRHKRSFLPGEIALIQSVANVMAAMLARRRADALLAERGTEKDEQTARLRATLAVMPDILLELDDDFRILSYHANPAVPRQVHLDTVLGKCLIGDFSTELTDVALQMRSDLQDDDIVDGYVFPHTVDDQTRRYTISAARIYADLDAGAARYVAIVRDITEAYEQRRKIQQLGRIVQTTTNLVVITDTQGRIEWANAAFEARTGHLLADVIGRRPGSFLHFAETDKKVVAKVRQAMERLQTITCELQNISSLGAPYWARMTIQPYFDETGQHLGFMSVQTDVTATRKLMQDMRNALAAEQAARIQLRSAVDQMKDALIMFDNAQRLVICNEQYRALYPELAEFLVPGALRSDLLRMGYQSGILGKGTPDLDAWLQRHERAFQMKYSQHKMRHLQGRWYRETQQPTADGGRICVLSDVTEWKNAEERALSDRARAMDASRDGILLVTPVGQIAYLNAAACRILALGDDSLAVGKDWGPMLFGSNSDKLLPQVEKELGRGGFWQDEIHMPRSGGTICMLEVSATQNSDGGILCIFRDITQRRRNETERETLREELTIARRREELSHIAAGLTHDFNNLLSVISGASLMIQDSDQIDMSRQLALRIADASDQAASLLRRMLTLGKGDNVRAQIDLRRPVRDAEALVRPGLRPPLGLHVDLPDAEVRTMADSTAVVQMLMNLIINARDALMEHTRPGETGLISVSMTLPDHTPHGTQMDIGAINPARRYACIRVSDNGPGMGPDVMSNVFQPYFSTKGDRGTGLGVPIVVNAVLDHGGALQLHSTLGQGTTFTIYWPLLDEDAPAKTPLTDRSVLLYSFDAARAVHITDALEAQGALVVPCDTLAKATMLAADAGDWDALVLDLRAAEDLTHARNAAPLVAQVALAQGKLADLAESVLPVCRVVPDADGFGTALTDLLTAQFSPTG